MNEPTRIVCLPLASLTVVFLAGCGGSVAPVASLEYGAPTVVPGTPIGARISGHNQSKQLVGYSSAGPGGLFWPNPMAAPQAILGNGALPFAISENGAIVGHENGPAFWASPTAKPRILPVPQQYIGFGQEATALTADDRVVGFFIDPNAVYAVSWASPTSEPLFLQGALPPPPIRISDSGTVLASPSLEVSGVPIDPVGGPSFIWANGASPPVMLLPVTPGATATAVDMNKSGTVLGYETFAGRNSGVVWKPPAYKPQFLPGPGLAGSMPTSINKSGAILASAIDLKGQKLTVLWLPGKTCVDIKTLVKDPRGLNFVGGGIIFEDYSVILNATDSKGAQEMVYLPVVSGP